LHGRRQAQEGRDPNPASRWGVLPASVAVRGGLGSEELVVSRLEGGERERCVRRGDWAVNS
jgi:hypothetical protein